MSPTARGRILYRASQIIRERNRELSELETLDTGKPIQETIVADSTSGADAMEFFGGVAPAALNGEQIPLGGDWAYTKRIPSASCSASARGTIRSRSPAGRPPPRSSPAMPSSSSRLKSPRSAAEDCRNHDRGGPAQGPLQRRAGRPRRRPAAGQPSGYRQGLAHGLRADRPQGGGAAAGQLKHVTMELGGKSPMIVFDDADVESAISGAMLGNFYSAGQVCSNGTRVFVQKGIKDQFLSRLKTRTEAIRMGEPLDEATQMGPLVNRSRAKRCFLYREGQGRRGTSLDRRRHPQRCLLRRLLRPADRLCRRDRRHDDRARRNLRPGHVRARFRP